MIALIPLPKDATTVRVDLENGQALLTFYDPDNTELCRIHLVNGGQAQGASVAIPSHVGGGGGSDRASAIIGNAHGAVRSGGSGGANVRGSFVKIEEH